MGDGEMRRWGDGEMGRWGDGEMGGWDCVKVEFPGYGRPRRVAPAGLKIKNGIYQEKDTPVS